MFRSPHAVDARLALCCCSLLGAMITPARAQTTPLAPEDRWISIGRIDENGLLHYSNGAAAYINAPTVDNLGPGPADVATHSVRVRLDPATGAVRSAAR